MFEEEIWKPVPKFTGKYEVSNMGRVRSLDRRIFYTKANGVRTSTAFKGQILSQRMSKHDGQVYVLLCDNGRQKQVAVARLVASAFIGIKDPNQYVYHKDGDAENNRVDNLFLGTRMAGKSFKVKSLTTGEVYKSIGEVSRKHNISEYFVRKYISEKTPIDGETYILLED